MIIAHILRHFTLELDPSQTFKLVCGMTVHLDPHPAVKFVPRDISTLSSVASAPATFCPISHSEWSQHPTTIIPAKPTARPHRSLRRVSSTTSSAH